MTANNNIDPARAMPVLASLNLEQTQAFYTGTLGFELIGTWDDYMIVRRDELELHFWLAPDRQFPENTSCYIRGGQIVDLYEEFKDKPFETGKLSAFEIRPWNMKEFHIHDPHGNLLRFGCAPEERDKEK